MSSVFTTKHSSEYELFTLEGLETSGTVVEVHDGDSITIVIKVPFIEKEFAWRCRLDGIDTPELTSKNPKEKEHAILARKFVKDLIFNQKIFVKCHKFDKYGRLLVSINIDSIGDLSEHIVKNNFGKKYEGGKKEKWTF